MALANPDDAKLMLQESNILAAKRYTGLMTFNWQETSLPSLATFQLLPT